MFDIDLWSSVGQLYMLPVHEMIRHVRWLVLNLTMIVLLWKVQSF